jgi:Chaperone of endosialidase
MGFFSRPKSPPPPNPELVRLQIESLQQQQEIARENLAMQQQVQPLQMEALKFGLDTQRTAFEQSQADRAYALEKREAYDKALQPLLDKAQGFNEADRRAELQADTDKAISAAYAQAPKQQARTLGRAGFGTSALQSQAATQAAAMHEATARAGTGHAISVQAKQEGLQAKSDALNLLAGYPAQASALTTSGAGIGAGGITGVNAGASGVYAPMSATSKIFGQIGAQAGDLYGQQAQRKFAADAAGAQQSSEMWGAAIGIVAMCAMSDRRLKENIRQIGVTADGLPLYRYNFKGSNEVEIGVMADEVEKIKPHAVYQIGPYKAVDYSKV